MSAQLPPVGPHPDVAVLLLSALVFSAPDDAADVLAWVRDDDLTDPAAAVVLSAIRTLVNARKTPGPQLILDELRRIGQFRGNVPDRLREATTAGACPEQAGQLAAAVVAESLRRRVESAGSALSAAAPAAAEWELSPLVATAATAVASCAHRLEMLRGEQI